MPATMPAARPAGLQSELQATAPPCAHPDQRHVKACLRNEAVLHAFGCTDELNFRLRMSGGKFARDDQGRDDVASGASGGEQESHIQF